MSKHDNQAAFESGLRQFIEKKAIPHILQVCEEVAQAMISRIESGGYIPVDTFNLRDSSGVGVYKNGVLISYTPRSVATVPNPENPPTWGHQEIEKALASGTTKYSQGIWLVLFGGTQPYAAEVNENHPTASDYMCRLVNYLTDTLFNKLERMNF